MEGLEFNLQWFFEELCFMQSVALTEGIWTIQCGISFYLYWAVCSNSALKKKWYVTNLRCNGVDWKQGQNILRALKHQHYPMYV